MERHGGAMGGPIWSDICTRDTTRSAVAVSGELEAGWLGWVSATSTPGRLTSASPNLVERETEESRRGEGETHFHGG